MSKRTSAVLTSVATLIIVFALCLTACSGRPPRNEDVVGHWTDTFHCETDKATYYYMHWYPGSSHPLNPPWIKRVDKRTGRAVWGRDMKVRSSEKILSKARSLGHVMWVNSIPRRPEKLAWGPVDASGLQMAAHPATDHNHSVWCVIRNAGKKPVHYSIYFAGYWEAMTVEARKPGASEWIKLEPANAEALPRKSAGAGPGSIGVLKPGEEVPFSMLGTRTGESLPADRRYSFEYWLPSYRWPDELSGKVEVRLSQRLGGDGSKNTWQGTLRSGVFCMQVMDWSKIISLPGPDGPSGGQEE